MEKETIITVFPFHHPDVYQAVPERELLQITHIPSSVPKLHFHWNVPKPIDVCISQRLLIRLVNEKELYCRSADCGLEIIELCPYHHPDVYQLAPDTDLILIPHNPITEIVIWDNPWIPTCQTVQLSVHLLILFAIGQKPVYRHSGSTVPIVEVYPFHSPDIYQSEPEGSLLALMYSIPEVPMVYSPHNLPSEIALWTNVVLINLSLAFLWYERLKDSSCKLIILDAEPFHHPDKFSTIQEKALLALIYTKPVVPAVYRNKNLPAALTITLSQRRIISYCCGWQKTDTVEDNYLSVIDVFPYHHPNRFSVEPERALLCIVQFPQRETARRVPMAIYSLLDRFTVLQIAEAYGKDQQPDEEDIDIFSGSEESVDVRKIINPFSPVATEQNLAGHDEDKQNTVSDEKLEQIDFRDSFDSSVLDFNEIIKALGERLSDGRLIGCNLLQIFENNDLRMQFIASAKVEIQKLVVLQTPMVNEQLIIITMIMVAMKHYDGEYWGHFRRIFSD
ncbi:hypothetical protein, partial [Faecalibaculum rodentium]|uniref:hypothetical protein n=1 Tax=Faecalibaculum rodentium TaxID=1702221 RepID=UPI0023F39887